MKSFECDALLFDLDGVLIDSTACIVRHWERWARNHNIEMDTIMQVGQGRRCVETIRLVTPHLSAEEEAMELEEDEASDTEGVVEAKGASQLIGAIPRDCWAVVTSSGRDRALARLRQTKIAAPRVLITADDVAQGKPDPEPYALAANQLSVAACRCLVVEDAPAGIQSARAAGMLVIGLGTTHPVQELAGAETVVMQLTDIHVSPNENPLLGRLNVRVVNVQTGCTSNRT